MDLPTFVRELGVAAALLFSVGGAALLGLLSGRRSKRDTIETSGFGVVQGAVLALLGLLLGFSFSAAMGRFAERQDILIREGNAMGTAYLRADLLEGPARDRLRALLREYADARIDLFKAHLPDAEPAVRERLSRLQAELWRAGVDGVAERPGLTVAVLGPINDVIDLLSVRNASAVRHIPGLILTVLIACAMVSVALVGFGLATADHRLRAAAGALIFLIVATLWITIDLDFPRAGFIRIDPTPLVEARAAMHPRTP